MLEILHFVFSSFWVFIGTLMILVVFLNMLIAVANVIGGGKS